MTIVRGGMLRRIMATAHAIAATVTASVTAGQYFRTASLAAMQPYFSLRRPLPQGPPMSNGFAA
jgi:hypothetical protein